MQFTAPCAELDAMSPESSNPVEASSNEEDVDNLREEGDDRWMSDHNTDDNPHVNVTVADEDSFVKSIKVQNTSNVESITVTVFDEEGNKVHILY